MYTFCVHWYTFNKSTLPRPLLFDCHRGAHATVQTFCPCVCSPFRKWGASRAGEERTLENSEEALFALAAAECVISREQVRLHLLELIGEFRSTFGHWSYAEYPKHNGRVEAVERAMRVIEAVLQDDEEQ